MLGRIFGILVLIAIFLVIAVLVNVIHFVFLPVNVVLWDSLLDVGIAAVITAVLYVAVLRRRLRLYDTEAFLALGVGVMAGAFYAVMVPTVIDRSLSIYILEKLVQRGGGIQVDAFDDIFRDEYMPEQRVVEIRLTEQLNSGSIVIEDDCVLLTDRGAWIASITRFYRATLLPKNREIMGEYTDALTDPFRESVQDVDYKCGPA